MRHRHPFKGTITDLAKTLGISRGHLSDILNHHETPSLTLAVAIQIATKGKIKAASLIKREGA